MKKNSLLRVGIRTLGCRLNQYESDGILQKFIESGRYRVCPVEEGPDLAIVNTCTVTDRADSRSCNAIRQLLRYNPDCKVIVTGCYAETNRQQCNLPEVFLVVGNRQKSSLFEIVEELLKQAKKRPHRQQREPEEQRHFQAKSQPKLERWGQYEYGPRPHLENPFGYGMVLPKGHTRAYLKIQDGCGRKCTYCKIPMARGPGVSRPVRDILEHVTHLDQMGIPEIVLTGVNLGWYRNRAEKLGFIDLLEKILPLLKHARLRLSSIEPCDVDAPLAKISQHPRFCNFLHVPLQSGSASILKAMRRTYTPFSFLRRIETVKSINSDLFLGTDVIVGFPGEREEDFEDTVKLCRDSGMANIHPFPYSPRQGTPAAGFADRIAVSVIRRRMKQMLALKEEGWYRYAKTCLGAEREGIVESISLLENIGAQNGAVENISTENASTEDISIENVSTKNVTTQMQLLTDDYLRVSLFSSFSSASAVEDSATVSLVAEENGRIRNLKKGQFVRLKLKNICKPFMITGKVA